MTSQTTPVLGLQLTAAGQAMKHVTVNDALLRLDALVHLAVLERNRNAPPAAPADGARYIVGTSPTGVFAGHAGAIASFEAGAWTFMPPKAGWRAYVTAEMGLIVFDGTVWRGFSPTEPIAQMNNVERLGLATVADAANPLSVRANNALFTALSTPAGTGDFRFKLNKDVPANTLSQLYQTGYSGRAETGLMGNDRFGVKVSADGTGWKLAMDIDPATGVVSMPCGVAGERASCRNRIINGAFSINQRAVSGTVTLAAGAYGHDRWKAGASGCTYTFATTGADTTITITAGTLMQVIEGANIGDAGSHVLSWSGTAGARVYQGAASGSYAAAPLQAGGLAAGTNTTVEFGTGTLTRVQFEAGTIATAFERRLASTELALCQRYFYAESGRVNYGYIVVSNDPGRRMTYTFPVTMRTTPTCTATWSGGSSPSVSANPQGVTCVVFVGESTTGVYVSAMTASAEL